MSTDFIDDNDLFIPSDYSGPNSKVTAVDVNTGQVDDIKNLPVLEQIKVSASRFNIPLNSKPKRNCKKCYERGYIGFNSVDKTPIVCMCMFPKTVDDKDKKDTIPLNFLSKAIQRKYFREKGKELIKEIRSERTLKQLRKVKDEVINKVLSENTEGNVNGTITQG